MDQANKAERLSHKWDLSCSECSVDSSTASVTSYDLTSNYPENYHNNNKALPPHDDKSGFQSPQTLRQTSCKMSCRTSRKTSCPTSRQNSPELHNSKLKDHPGGSPDIRTIVRRFSALELISRQCSSCPSTPSERRKSQAKSLPELNQKQTTSPIRSHNQCDTTCDTTCECCLLLASLCSTFVDITGFVLQSRVMLLTVTYNVAKLSWNTFLTNLFLRCIRLYGMAA